METIMTLPRAELLRRAVELGPWLRANAQAAEDRRRLSEDLLQALAGSGLLRMRVPLRYGGYESDMRTVTEVLAELARGDGSTAWTASVWMISSWMVGLFPDAVRDEVFADPDVRISGILSPGAMAAPVEGGYVVNGKWSFNTGAQQSTWNTNAAVTPTGDGGFAPVMIAVPISDLQVVDDWHTSGLRGSGSVTTIAQDLFVPAERVLQMGPVLQGLHQSKLNANSPVYQAPFMPTACATVSAPALGLALAAKDAFLDRLPGRKITYTSYDNQAEAPVTHLETADAITRVDEVAFHARRAADMIDAKSRAGETWTLEERARIRLDLGAACQRAKEAVDILNSASGGSSVYQDVAIQRIQRDVQVLNLHAILHPSTNLELYGRIVCGLDANTPYV